MGQVFIFGIDGATPELIFDKWLGDLPNIKNLMEKGAYAKINSTIPPATIIAWTSMVSGKDASEIGVFNYTKDGRLVNSTDVKCKRVWDILSEKGKKSIALYVPLTYPVNEINGVMVGGFLTPEINDKCVFPLKYKEKIESLANEDVFFDVAVGLAGHKGLEIDKLVDKTIEMTEAQLKFLKHCLENEEWDFFMTVMLGTDRLQHMVWRHFDEEHRKFIPDSKFKNTLKNYYTYLDKRLGEILEMLPEDTTIIVTSDHGMVRQEGKININNWLIQEGYLVLNQEFKEKTRFNQDFVDWDKTLAYGGGAYNGRIYINKEKCENYEELREEIARKLMEITDDKGKELDTKIYKKEEVYVNVDDPNCPDLTVYFDDLRWASNPDLGQEGLYSWESALGADSAGHARQGCFVISGKSLKKTGDIGEVDIAQVMPTILKLLDVDIPEDIKQKNIEVI